MVTIADQAPIRVSEVDVNKTEEVGVDKQENITE
jgi:hypothetical protein